MPDGRWPVGAEDRVGQRELVAALRVEALVGRELHGASHAADAPGHPARRPGQEDRAGGHRRGVELLIERDRELGVEGDVPRSLLYGEGGND